MPNYWLAKSEPEAYSIDQLKKDKRTFWDGVRNYAARNNMMAMKKGDLAFFYRSNAEPSGIVGIMKVVAEARPDPTQFMKDEDPMHYDPKATKEKPIWHAVEFGFVEKWDEPLSLADIKKNAALKEMKLLKVSRLSVSPVTQKEWNAVLSMAKKK